MKRDNLPNEKNQSPPKKEKRPSFFGRVFALLVTAILILGAVLLVAYRDIWDIDALKRTVTYRNLTQSDTGQAEPFFYYQGKDLQLYAVGDDLLVSSESTVRMYSQSGSLYVEDVLAYGNPIVQTVGDLALIYDSGGQNFILYDDNQSQYSISLDSTETLLDASVNQKGWVVATVRDSGSKGHSTVYDENGTAIMEISLSSAFLMGAALSPDCSQLALLTTELNGTTFESHLSFYSVDGKTSGEATPTATCAMTDTLLLDFSWDDQGIWCLEEDQLTLWDVNGNLLTQYEFDLSYFSDYSFDGNGFATLLLSSDQWGTQSQISTITSDAEVYTLSIEEPILSCTTAGSYVAVLTASNLTIYNDQLELYSTLEDTQGAQTALIRDDGSALLLDGQLAWLYIP